MLSKEWSNQQHQRYDRQENSFFHVFTSFILLGCAHCDIGAHCIYYKLQFYLPHYLKEVFFTYPNGWFFV